MGVFGATPSEAYQGEMHKPSQFMVFQPGFTDYEGECFSVVGDHWIIPNDQPATTFIASPLSARLHIPCIGGLDDFVTLDWIWL